jgi:hypothetical protein
MALLVRGTVLARSDAVLARSLPIVFWNLRDSLEPRALLSHAARAEEKHAVGFFVELAGVLGQDRRLVGVAEQFRDRRVTSLRDFFLNVSPRRRELARDFPVAAKWGFRMNMDLESFRSLFDKFVVR